MRSSRANSVPPALRANRAPSRTCDGSSWTRSADAGLGLARKAARTIRSLGAKSLRVTAVTSLRRWSAPSSPSARTSATARRPCARRWGACGACRGSRFAGSRPSALWKRDDQRAAAQSAAPAVARAQVRPGAARRAGSRPRGARPGADPRPSLRARLRPMSHLDELDEFEAELELRLKKEYTAVFGLFR